MWLRFMIAQRGSAGVGEVCQWGSMPNMPVCERLASPGCRDRLAVQLSNGSERVANERLLARGIRQEVSHTRNRLPLSAWLALGVGPCIVRMQSVRDVELGELGELGGTLATGQTHRSA